MHSLLQQQLRSKKRFLEQRSFILRVIRQWFEQRDFLELQTPFVLPYSSVEAHLLPVEIQFQDEVACLHTGFLRTSPELSLKKALASGYDKIYEIAACFRNQEPLNSSLHNGEFTLLEWYRLNSDYLNIMDDVSSLLSHVVKCCFKNTTSPFPSTSTSTLRKHFDSNELLEHSPIQQYSVADLFRTHAQVDFDQLDNWKSLLSVAHKKGFLNAQNLHEAFQLIFLTEIEPKLAKITSPLIIRDYPCFEGAYARRLASSLPQKEYVQRFELYWKGVELANAYTELTDPDEQVRRMQQNYKTIAACSSQKASMIDPDFIDCLKSISHAGGIALGIDRLVMLLTGASSIDQVMLLPIKNR